MRLVLISDTHMVHDTLTIPDCDVLIHAGDFTCHGTRREVLTFLDWFAAQPARHHVLIAGNHDFWCEREPAAMAREAQRLGIHYLVDAGVRVDGTHIWGSPVTPEHLYMAFNRCRQAMPRHWQRLPAGVDVLVTHGPPAGIGDRLHNGERVGCAGLREAIAAQAPRLHVFGHIHEDFGHFRVPELATQFHNASTCLPGEGGVRRPVVVDWN